MMQLESRSSALVSRLDEGVALAPRPSTPSMVTRSASTPLRRHCRAAGAAVAAGLLLLLGLPRAAAADPDPLDPTRLPTQVIYNYGENETPRSAAMGGALRALGSGTSAVHLNPATMAATRVYHLGAFTQLAPETSRYILGGTVVDSATGRLAGSVSVNGGWIDQRDTAGVNRSILDVRAALAYPFGDRVFLGLGGRYAWIKQEARRPPFGKNDAAAGGLHQTPVTNDNQDDRQASVNTVTFDAGLTVKLTDSVYIAAVGQNLTFLNNGLLPTTVGGGVGFGGQSFSIEADGLADLSSWGKPTARVMAGGEYLAAGHVPIRVGYQFDQGARLHTLSAGTGYIGTAFSIEASFKRTLAHPGTTTFLLSMAYFFESSGLIRARTAVDAD